MANSSCVVCQKKCLENGIHSPWRNRRESIILLACLQAANVLSMESASKAHRAIQMSPSYMCSDHYVQAASYIGKQVECTWDKLPEHGLDQVPYNIKDDLLTCLQIYAENLDEGVTLQMDDITHFFNSYIKQYCQFDDSYTLVTRSATFDSLKSSFTSIDHDIELVDPSVLVEHPLKQTKECIGPAVDVQLSLLPPKCELACSSGISAMELIVLAPPLLPEQTDANYNQLEQITASCPIDPPMIIRDKSSCLDTMNDTEFRKKFRFTRRTFLILCNTLEIWLRSVPNTYLSKRLRKVTCATGIKVAMVLEMLAGNAVPTAGGPILQKSASQIFCGVMEAMAQWSTTMIHWPDEAESKKISQSFFEMTGLSDIVGCLDATIVKGKQPLNVGLISDDKMRFRWVFAKFHADAEDEMVFKQSLLCRQLRDGTRKGRLVGDDAFNSELFLMTPSMGNDEMKEGDLFLANRLCKAHVTVQKAITNWKTQFPILSGNQRSGKTARIVVCSAALYNLARRENEPIFSEVG
ncbi:hypothetical protein DICVIV_10188 [Dictyocaulus viviparus]|uniref:DDE Tnp4 domain-containing protein n=1 Tax=Dictyocaulus viviparus TaxID=29172 RepID=A0A0D8XN47_DICVI|nr:hypothetical protein DICVIV_10188 [Dictyocaulus viviparus]